MQISKVDLSNSKQGDKVIVAHMGWRTSTFETTIKRITPKRKYIVLNNASADGKYYSIDDKHFDFNGGQIGEPGAWFDRIVEVK